MSAAIHIGLGDVAAALALVLALGVFHATARYLVLVGGMVIGNAMTASAVALNRLGDDVHDAAARMRPPSRSEPPPPRRSGPSRGAACAPG